MNSYLPFWAGGIALAAVVLLHFLLLRSQLAVSGRVTALVNRLRAKAAHEPELSDKEMLEALRAMTEAEFGIEALAPAAEVVEPALKRKNPSSPTHLLFLFGLALGGALTAIFRGGFSFVPSLAGVGFESFFGSGALGALALFAGGILVGIGTRMAGGCTSGHGLVGLPRLEKGSLLATCAFFGTGIAVSLALEVFR